MNIVYTVKPCVNTSLFTFIHIPREIVSQVVSNLEGETSGTLMKVEDWFGDQAAY